LEVPRRTQPVSSFAPPQALQNRERDGFSAAQREEIMVASV
jgi:hypothetical protein